MIFGGLIARIGASVLFGRVKNIVAKVPRWVWLTLAVVIALLAAVLVHQHYAQKRIDAAYAQGKADANKQWAEAFESMRKTSEAWKQRYETKSDALTNLERTRHEETLRANAARADDLRLHGPGRASAAYCRPGNDPRLSGLPGGQDGTPAQPDAPGPQVPSGDGFAIVPWSWLVQRAEEHDALLSEVTTSRRWHTEQEALRNEAIKDLKDRLPDPKF